VTAVYAVAVVVINKKFKASNRVHTINNIIEYADALICKFNNLGLASARSLYLALEHGPDRINNMLEEAGYSKLHLSTINLLRKESFRTSNCTERQSICWYNDTIIMIGDDDEVNFTDFPGIRAIIKATATSQGWHVPIRWINNVTAKLALSGILSTSKLRDEINSFQAMVPLTAPLFGVIFLRGHIFIKNWTYCPVLRDSTSPFKSTCLLTTLKQAKNALYGLTVL
jgi:hypothetical protein